MQLGNLVVGTVVGLGIALVTTDPGLAIAVCVAVVLKLVSERVLRRGSRATWRCDSDRARASRAHGCGGDVRRRGRASRPAT